MTGEVRDGERDGRFGEKSCKHAWSPHSCGEQESVAGYHALGTVRRADCEPSDGVVLCV